MPQAGAVDTPHAERLHPGHEGMRNRTQQTPACKPPQRSAPRERATPSRLTSSAAFERRNAETLHPGHREACPGLLTATLGASPRAKRETWRGMTPPGPSITALSPKTIWQEPPQRGRSTLDQLLHLRVSLRGGCADDRAVEVCLCYAKAFDTIDYGKAILDICRPRCLCKLLAGPRLSLTRDQR
ncbi:hypothetical protein LSM04_000161 [Trypanosoma melophagium]|uniref:uncharacterized protein n=1 Tax=Trypanosoma melophagium TaxID=715481 RepID=UPI00351A5AE0|nr:hypothetical protein LSM04_000161 [Trypanosoma melophagium]